LVKLINLTGQKVVDVLLMVGKLKIHSNQIS